MESDCCNCGTVWFERSNMCTSRECGGAAGLRRWIGDAGCCVEGCGHAPGIVTWRLHQPNPIAPATSKCSVISSSPPLLVRLAARSQSASAPSLRQRSLSLPRLPLHHRKAAAATCPHRHAPPRTSTLHALVLRHPRALRPRLSRWTHHYLGPIPASTSSRPLSRLPERSPPLPRGFGMPRNRC